MNHFNDVRSSYLKCRNKDYGTYRTYDDNSLLLHK